MGYIFILEICDICRYVEGWYTDVRPRYGDLFHEDMSSLLLPLIKSQVLEVQGIPLIYTGTKLACYFKQHVSVGIMFMTGILV